MIKTKFDVQGMTCSSCVAHVEKAVNKLEGVNKVNVNLLSNSMIVEYNEDVLKSERIIQAVIDAGYNANVGEGKSQKEDKRDSVLDNIKSMKKRLILSVCFLIPLMYVAMGHMLNLPMPSFLHGDKNVISFAFTQFLLLLPILYLNRNYYISGFKKLFCGSPNMDSLIAIGSAAATVYGIFIIYMLAYGFSYNDLSTIERYSKDIYFESAGMILTLITFGKFLEARSKGKTSEAISKLINLAPKTAIVIRNDREVEIMSKDIIEGDIVVIKPGASIPVDGIVVEGASTVDQASITGESIPVTKMMGDNVVSGTINKTGYFKMKATKVGENTTLAQIIRLVEEAANSKAPISKIADKVSGIFVPAVILIAVVTIVVWLMVGQTFEFALTMGIAVLVISCPCALGLATPVAIMVGTGKGAENGILIKSAESLELLHSVDTVVLDKTGTITEGRPKVTDIVSNIDEIELLKIAGSLENNSEHPLAEAVLEKLAERNIEIKEIKEFRVEVGKGVKGKVDGVLCFAGNAKYMQENNVDVSEMKQKADALLKQGKTLLYFAREEKLIGLIAVADTLKEMSKNAVEELTKRKIEVIMLTGDNKVTAQAIADKLKIENVIAEVLPQDKEKEVLNLQKQNKKVAFVGDGINDSPALTRADVGIAIGSGTDIAIESADIVLMKDNLLDVVTAIDLSRAVIRNIKMNLFWAFFYNTIGIPVAAGVFFTQFGLRLNPMIAAAAMSLSSVCVVTNALRLRKFRTNYKEEIKMGESEKIIKINGMQCNHCKMTVEKVLSAIDGVGSVDVVLEDKIAKIKTTKSVDDAEIKKVIEEAGFVVVE